MFNLRPYGKAELALLYQPCSTPESAVKTLNRWINGCPLLLEELKSIHYQPRRHTFLKPEVQAIVKHLGEPWIRLPDKESNMLILHNTLSNDVFSEGELEIENNTHFLRVVGVKQPVAYYNLDVIISVGYRVKSHRGVKFRQW